MNIERIKKKYPYRESVATIIKILNCHINEGFIPTYDRYDAIQDLENDKMKYGGSEIFGGTFHYSKYDIYYKVSEHAQRHSGIVEEDFFGDPVSKVYRLWYEYKLLVEYEDNSGAKRQNIVELTSEKELQCGDIILICYLIDNPDVIASQDLSKKTIEEYYRNRKVIFLSIIFLLTVCGVLVAIWFFYNKYK